MGSMQIRIVEQTDPDESKPNGWYKIEDFDAEDAAAIRAGTLVRYTVEIIGKGEDGAVCVLADSLNHVGKPGLARVYRHYWDIDWSATEMIRAARDELTGAAGLEVGSHVELPGRRAHGAGRLYEVVEVPKDEEGFGLGVVVIRQIDAPAGEGGPQRLGVDVVSKEISPRKPIIGRNRGGLRESFRKREGGGFLVYNGDYADLVVMSARMAGLDTSGWVCRSIDEFEPEAWVSGWDRAQAITNHGRKYPNKGVTW